MAEPKTQKNRKSVKKFIENVPHATRRSDAHTLLDLMEEVTQEKAAMWGESLVGFSSYDMGYADGSTRKWPLVGFSPRKANLVVYVMSGFSECQHLLATLGKHKHGVSCLYVNKLADIDLKVLKRILKHSIAGIRKWEKKSGDRG